MKNILKHKEKTGQNNQEPSIPPEKAAQADAILDGSTTNIHVESNSPECDMQSILNEKQKACDELLDRLQRTMAEFDNFRKRSIKEKASMYDDGVRDTAEKLLPIVDNFERAVHGGGAGNQGDSFHKGVEMILRQVYGLLDDIGVEAISALNEAFDPNLHYAVAHIEDEAIGENTVIEEMQRGYKYKGKVIRPSMVKVAN